MAETTKFTSSPNLVSAAGGRFRMGAAPGATVTRSVTAVPSACTDIVDDHRFACGSEYTLKPISACPRRLVKGKGTLRLGLSLDTNRRVVCGTFGTFNRTVQSKESPAWRVFG